MRWLKHMVDTWDDERVSKALGAGGKDGMALYGAFWRVLEIVAKQMSKDNLTCSVNYSVSKWSLLMSVRGSHLRHYMGQLAGHGLIQAEWTGTELRVTIPNLKKYKDEYTQKSGQAPDANKETDTEIRTDTEIKSSSVSSTGTTARRPPAQQQTTTTSPQTISASTESHLAKPVQHVNGALALNGSPPVPVSVPVEANTSPPSAASPPNGVGRVLQMPRASPLADYDPKTDPEFMLRECVRELHAVHWTLCPLPTAEAAVLQAYRPYAPTKSAADFAAALRKSHAEHKAHYESLEDPKEYKPQLHIWLRDSMFAQKTPSTGKATSKREKKPREMPTLTAPPGWE